MFQIMDLNEVFSNIQQVIILLRQIVQLLMLETNTQSNEIRDTSIMEQMVILLQQTIDLLATEGEDETQFIVNLQWGYEYGRS